MEKKKMKFTSSQLATFVDFIDRVDGTSITWTRKPRTGLLTISSREACRKSVLGFPRRKNPIPALKARCIQVSEPQELFNKLSQFSIPLIFFEDSLAHSIIQWSIDLQSCPISFLLSNTVKKPLESKGLWSSLRSKAPNLPCPNGSLSLSKKRASKEVAPLKHKERRNLWCDGYKKEVMVIDELSTPVIAFMSCFSLVLHSFSPDQAGGGIIVSYSEGPSRPLSQFPPKPLQEEFNKDNNNLVLEQLPSGWEAMNQLLHGVRTVTFSGEAMGQANAWS
ncbi:hypothetical protein F2Q70_00008206 [Brassica cretica]|uniref:Uncharacterized protein n=1 Tax=Brassica cretica TaxID=69181 RepID=A0A3N6QG75_BRACR|nr:hypothetical protein F2Q70_00008206 [Brassica cretica]KAF3593423.1 hypothetical protein DY000_02023136 [Brassica cretica]